MNSVEILEKKADLKREAVEMCETCKTEIRDMSTAEKERFDEIEKQINDLNDELRKLDVAISSEEKNNLTNQKKTMNKEFRLVKAIRDIANNQTLDAVSSAVVNEGKEEMRKSGVNFEGQIQIPVETRSEITVASEGEDVVVTNFTNILEPLRAKNVLVGAGARYLTGLVGDVQIPNMTASNVTWEGETVAATDGAGSFGNVKLQPKRLTAYVDVSKQFLVQDSLDAEALIRQDILNAINSKLEATILGSAAGTSTQPEGIFYSESALTSIASFADICNLEADIEDANILGECKYVMSNKAKAALRNMAKSTKSTQLVMEGGQIDGTDVFNTSHVGGKKVAYGDFSNLVIGQWGAIDLTVDPFSQATNGKVRIVVNAFFDAKIVRDGAIAVAEVA